MTFGGDLYPVRDVVERTPLEFTSVEKEAFARWWKTNPVGEGALIRGEKTPPTPRGYHGGEKYPPRLFQVSVEAHRRNPVGFFVPFCLRALAGKPHRIDPEGLLKIWVGFTLETAAAFSGGFGGEIAGDFCPELEAAVSRVGRFAFFEKGRPVSARSFVDASIKILESIIDFPL